MKTGHNSIRAATRPQGNSRQLSVIPHASLRAYQRRSPLKFPIAAVRRQLPKIDALCPERGSRATVDYREGKAIVERRPGSSVGIVTLLQTWMAADNVPVVIDLPPQETKDPARYGVKRSEATARVMDILSARDTAKLRAIARP